MSTPPRAPGGFVDLFSGHAPLYAAARPRYPAALFAWIASQAPAPDRAWDCGTGNGQAALGLAAHFAEVQASDPSAEQVAQAAPHPRVRYTVQPAEATRFAAAQFDAVCVAQALHWFDLAAFMREAQRVMKPGALFCAFGYSAMAVSPEIDTVVDGQLLPALAPHWAPQNRRLWAGYRDAALPFEPIDAPAFEIRVDWSLHELLAYLRTWSATQALLAQGGAAALDAIAAQLARHWGDDPQAPRTVTMPLAMRAGRYAG